MSGYNCKMALLQCLKRNDKPKVPLPSKLILLSECQIQQENKHMRKFVGDKVTTSGTGKKWRLQYKYSAKEKVNISNIP